MKGKMLLCPSEQKVKKIVLMQDPQKLKMILSQLSWQILAMLLDNEMYPLEIARKLGIHEQKVYYHIRKLVDAGAIAVVREEEKKGAMARYYRSVSPAFGIELQGGWRTVRSLRPLDIDDQIVKFFKEFLSDDRAFEGRIIVGSPTPHGPFRTSARDGHYASHLAFFLGQFARMPNEFSIKLDVDVKAEKEEKSNMILVGGPGTNLLTQKLNEYLPIRFNMQPSRQGFLLGGLVSNRTSRTYSADVIGLIAKITNPWESSKRIILLAGNKAVGTKACVLALTNSWEKTLKGHRNEDTFARVVQGVDLDGDGKVDSTEILE